MDDGGRSDPHDGPDGGNPTDPDDGTDVADPNGLNVALHVEDSAGVDRIGEPVRSGVPIPRAVQMTDASRFMVVDPEGVTVPAQVTVTSRWQGEPDDVSKPIKWLLVDFVADVPAGSRSTYRLRTKAASASSEANPAEAAAVSETANEIVVDTGAARFTISKTRFNLFDRVELADGTALVESDPDRGIYLQTAAGARYLAATGATDVAVEESGPLHVVVVARGKHENAAGESMLDFTVRMHFWQGSAESKVSYTFTERDLGSIRSYVGLDEVGIELPTLLGGETRFAIGGAQEPATGALQAGGAWQRQTGNLSAAMAAMFNPGNADTISFANGGDATGSGGKAPGWIGGSGENGGVTAALRWYWQQYPKKLSVTPGMLAVELWPSEDVDMRVYASSQKTHEVIFGFHEKGASLESAGAAEAIRLDHPLVARCNPSWYARTQVWNRIGVADPDAYESEHKYVAAAFYENLLQEEFPETFGNRRFDSGGRGHEYGMWDFGDGRESSGWSNLAYDTPRSLFLHWAMTGNRDLLDRGTEALLHLRDVDIEHSPKDTRAGITTNRGVTMPWLGRTRYNPTRGPQAHDLGFEGAVGFGFEHHKGQSLADHYFLTGDRLSKEVLAETYHYYEQWLVDAESGYLRQGGGSRTVSHMLNVVLGYYDAYGTAEARDRADYIVQYLNDWQRMTSSNDPQGWMWNGTDDDSTSAFMNAVTAESLVLYEVMFPDGIPVRDNLVDAARWTIDPDNDQLEDGSQGLYFNAWTNNNYGADHATVLDPMMGPMLGYAYGATGEREFADIASEVMLNSFSQDSSTPYVKAFTQQTRLVPPFLYFLQKPEAQEEAGLAGIAP